MRRSKGIIFFQSKTHAVCNNDEQKLVRRSKYLGIEFLSPWTIMLARKHNEKIAGKTLLVLIDLLGRLYL